MASRTGALLRPLAAWASLGVVLAGCDTVYGVQREAQIASLPKGDCVAGILATLPEIRRVDRTTTPPREVFTFYGWVMPEGPSEHFVYFGTGDSMFANLYMGPGSYARPTFEQSMGTMGGLPRQSAVDAVRFAMVRIEQRVSTECGRPEVAAAIVEHCSKGLSCPPLPVASPAASPASVAR